MCDLRVRRGARQEPRAAVSKARSAVTAAVASAATTTSAASTAVAISASAASATSAAVTAAATVATTAAVAAATAVAAPATATVTAAARCALFRFVDAQLPTIDLEHVTRGQDHVRCAVFQLHEGEPLRAPGIAIDDHARGQHLPVLSE